MKHLKKYEKTIHNINIDDYAITNKPSEFDDPTTSEILKFTSLNIGKVVDIYKKWIILKYDNIPEEIKKYSTNNNIFKIKYYYIEYNSKDKNELETYLNTNKYNL